MSLGFNPFAYKMECRDIKDILINKSLPEVISSLTNIMNELNQRGVDLTKTNIDDNVSDFLDYYIEVTFPVPLSEEELDQQRKMINKKHGFCL